MDDNAQNREPTINFDAVPEYVKDDLASYFLKRIRSFVATPEGKAFLDERIQSNKNKRREEVNA